MKAARASPIFQFNKAIIDATADLVCAYKPQFAHYAACEAEDQLQRTIEYIHRSYPGIAVILDAKQHDRTLAYTSHLPQLASTALAMLLAQKDYTRDKVFGPALVDSTRLALSPYEIWADILATNPAWIDAALAGYIGSLEALRRDLNSAAMAAHFQSAAEVAGRIRER